MLSIIIDCYRKRLLSFYKLERFHLTVERDWFWFWFWFYYALWLASVFTLVLVLRQSSENRSNQRHNAVCMVSLSHSIIIACNHGLQSSTKYYRNKNNNKNVWSFHRSSASVQFIIQEEEEVAAKVAVCNPRLVS